ncbi:MAG: DNA-3-methyladenine glycosylase [Acidimicrobiia bacterium]|nr:DNA-3-methyladenine glycosylase [Acidimicrobiia bacterium]
MTNLREILSDPPEEAAPRLLGCHLVSEVGDELVRLRIGEVEAYKGRDDPASHAYRGRTKRNGSMFGTPGTLYTYLSYGVHTAANTAAGPEGVGWGILIRGGEVVDGRATAVRRRGREDQIADGPGKLTQALGIRLDHNGLDLLSPTSVVRLEAGESPGVVIATPRVGISKARDRHWRFVAADVATVS